MASSFRKFFYPPYTSQNIPILAGILIILIILPFTVFFVLSSKEDTRSRAEEPQKKVALDHAVSFLPSHDIQIISPTSQATISTSTTLQIMLSPSISATSVEVWKDNDKTPFVILYQPTDTTNGNLYEVSLLSLHPGRHTVHANAILPDDNVLMSDETVFSLQ